MSLTELLSGCWSELKSLESLTGVKVGSLLRLLMHMYGRMVLAGNRSAQFIAM